MILEDMDIRKLALFIPMIAIVAAAIVAAVAIVSFHWRRLRETEMEMSLKSQMIERGMAAEEIEKVLEAGFEVRGLRRVVRGVRRLWQEGVKT